MYITATRMQRSPLLVSFFTYHTAYLDHSPLNPRPTILCQC